MGDREKIPLSLGRQFFNAFDTNCANFLQKKILSDTTCGMSQTNITTYIELKMHTMNFRHYSASAWGDFLLKDGIHILNVIRKKYLFLEVGESAHAPSSHLRIQRGWVKTFWT